VVVLVALLTSGFKSAIITTIAVEFWGTIGMFVAVPVAGLVKLILAESVQLIRDIN